MDTVPGYFEIAAKLVKSCIMRGNLREFVCHPFYPQDEQRKEAETAEKEIIRLNTDIAGLVTDLQQVEKLNPDLGMNQVSELLGRSLDAAEVGIVWLLFFDSVVGHGDAYGKRILMDCVDGSISDVVVARQYLQSDSSLRTAKIMVGCRSGRRGTISLLDRGYVASEAVQRLISQGSNAPVAAWECQQIDHALFAEENQ